MDGARERLQSTRHPALKRGRALVLRPPAASVRICDLRGELMASQWYRRVQQSPELSAAQKERVLGLFKFILVGLLRDQPEAPLPFMRERVEAQMHGDATLTWVVPPDYDYTKATNEVHRVPGTAVVGDYTDIRSTLDFAYHGNYSHARQLYQDVIIRDIIGGACAKEHPWLVFTAGAMGAGKSYTIRWMSDHGYFPLPDIVQIDPDRFKEMLPEWDGYCTRDPRVSGSKCHRESGYLVEVATEAALRLKKNVWVDGSLRDAEWYTQVFAKIKEEHPEYRIAILHVKAPLDVVLQRAESRGKVTGRFVPENEIIDSHKRVPQAVLELGGSGHCNFVAHIQNDGVAPPRLEEYCDEFECRFNRNDSWDEIRKRFSTHPEIAGGQASQDFETVVEAILESHDFVLFSKSYCSQSHKLEGVLDKHGVRYRAVVLDKLPGGGVGIQLAVSRRIGSTTMPQLFHLGKNLGGYAEVMKLYEQNKMPRSGHLSFMGRNGESFRQCSRAPHLHATLSALWPGTALSSPASSARGAGSPRHDSDDPSLAGEKCPLPYRISSARHFSGIPEEHSFFMHDTTHTLPVDPADGRTDTAPACEFIHTHPARGDASGGTDASDALDGMNLTVGLGVSHTVSMCESSRHDDAAGAPRHADPTRLMSGGEGAIVASASSSYGDMNNAS
eukprot:TRINITY_DN3657_c2_g1_i1.p1 TRINITY_DN3657_c2_g1~~TRINITY_DN3657_c2_g1_i1.p1  ORF type:complete len:672 (+),score=241.48 TRINITY_DN3657_c2_g1_i1:103-2118(+)